MQSYSLHKHFDNWNLRYCPTYCILDIFPEGSWMKMLSHSVSMNIRWRFIRNLYLSFIFLWMDNIFGPVLCGERSRYFWWSHVFFSFVESASRWNLCSFWNWFRSVENGVLFFCHQTVFPFFEKPIDRLSAAENLNRNSSHAIFQWVWQMVCIGALEMGYWHLYIDLDFKYPELHTYSSDRTALETALRLRSFSAITSEFVKISDRPDEL